MPLNGNGRDFAQVAITTIETTRINTIFMNVSDHDENFVEDALICLDHNTLNGPNTS